MGTQPETADTDKGTLKVLINSSATQQSSIGEAQLLRSGSISGIKAAPN